MLTSPLAAPSAPPSPPCVALAQALIRAPSITPHDSGAMAVVADAARAAGFEVDVFESCVDGQCIKNLIGRMGDAKSMLAFIGHTDVVPPGDAAAWRHPPFAGAIEDGQLYGRGAVDMKGAIAAFLVAAQRFRERVKTPPFALQLLITGDEEQGSAAGMRAILARCQSQGMLPDFGLIGEASNEGYLGQGIRVGRRGSINVNVESLGVQGHVAWPHRAQNAVHPLTTYLAQLQGTDWGAPDSIFPATSLQVTNISVDNEATNVVPARATARFNIRFNRRYTGVSLDALLRKAAANVSTQLRVSTRVSGEPYLSNAEPLASALARASEAVTGHVPERNAGGGVSDGRFLYQFVPVVEFGLVGDCAHQANEHVAVRDIVALTSIYERTLDDLSSGMRQSPHRSE